MYTYLLIKRSPALTVYKFSFKLQTMYGNRYVVKVKFTQDLAMKAQRGSRGTSLLILNLSIR
jgi:hypothetical protein